MSIGYLHGITSPSMAIYGPRIDHSFSLFNETWKLGYDVEDKIIEVNPG
jgi:hypothetical protein